MNSDSVSSEYKIYPNFYHTITGVQKCLYPFKDLFDIFYVELYLKKY